MAAYAQVMARRSKRLALGLAGFQLTDAAFNAVGLYDIARSSRVGNRVKEWTKDDLDRLRFPERLRFVFPIVKSSSAAGLLVGLRWPRLGRFTAGALMAYFTVAIGFHRRAKDPFANVAPALGMLAWSASTFRALRRRDDSAVPPSSYS